MKEGIKYYHTYSNKVFGGWDMCIEEQAAAKLQIMRFVKDIEVRLLPFIRLFSVKYCIANDKNVSILEGNEKFLGIRQAIIVCELRIVCHSCDSCDTLVDSKT